VRSRGEINARFSLEGLWKKDMGCGVVIMKKRRKGRLLFSE
jgi:hypothetical protein